MLFVVTSVACVLSIIISIFFIDQPLSAWAASPWVQEHLRRFFRDITDFGLSEIYFALSILGFLTSIAIQKFNFLSSTIEHYISGFQNKTLFLRNWCINLFLALLFSGFVTHLFKFLIGRARPHKTEDFNPLVFEPFNTHWHWHSMPSGHSQTMFTVATMMTAAFPKRWWIWYSFAVLICFSRIITLDHLLSDTIVGSYIGFYCTMYVLHKSKYRLKQNEI
jgi:membrane-associated phospholipid phosphatase